MCRVCNNSGTARHIACCAFAYGQQNIRPKAPPQDLLSICSELLLGFMTVVVMGVAHVSSPPATPKLDELEDIVAPLFISSLYSPGPEKYNELSLGCELESKTHDDDNVLTKGNFRHFHVRRISEGQIKMSFASVQRTSSIRLKKEHECLESGP
jgi:hypothetical protein